MIIIIRSAAIAAVFAGAAVGLAGPASAEPLEGPYTVVVTDGGHSPSGSKYRLGPQGTQVATPCGADCFRLAEPGDPVPVEFHLQGNTWSGTDVEGCGISIDNGSLAGTMQCSNAFMGFRLSKGG